MSVSKYQKYIDNSLKPPKKFFDWCYSQIHTFKWSNKSETILASDRNNCEGMLHCGDEMGVMED